MDTASRLRQVSAIIDDIAERLENARTLDNATVDDVIQHCQEIDKMYALMCDEIDEECGQEHGTSYKNGVSIEFYIEADWWHPISLALRKLRKKED